MSKARETADVVDSKNQCTAWCVFDGLASTLKSTFNFVSAVRVSQGLFTVTFSTPMDNVDYSVSITSVNILNNGTWRSYINKTVDGFQMYIVSNSGALEDSTDVSVQVFGGKN